MVLISRKKSIHVFFFFESITVMYFSAFLVFILNVICVDSIVYHFFFLIVMNIVTRTDMLVPRSKIIIKSRRTMDQDPTDFKI